jgi:hypothetical protein
MNRAEEDAVATGRDDPPIEIDDVTLGTELAAMQRCVDALVPLGPSQRARILRYLVDRFGG